jgi:hypothetical protein
MMMKTMMMKEMKMMMKTMKMKEKKMMKMTIDNNSIFEFF